jgi:hypothetical protein
MSGSNKAGGYQPSRLTTDEFQRLAKLFKELLAENPLVRASIIAAGVGGAFGTLHVLWMAARFLVRR